MANFRIIPTSRVQFGLIRLNTNCNFISYLIATLYSIYLKMASNWEDEFDLLDEPKKKKNNTSSKKVIEDNEFVDF